MLKAQLEKVQEATRARGAGTGAGAGEGKDIAARTGADADLFVPAYIPYSPTQAYSSFLNLPRPRDPGGPFLNAPLGGLLPSLTCFSMVALSSLPV